MFLEEVALLSVTNHFPHDSCSNMLCSHFFHVIFEGLLDKDHEHHANQSNNTDLHKKKETPAYEELTCRMPFRLDQQFFSLNILLL